MKIEKFGLLLFLLVSVALPFNAAHASIAYTGDCHVVSISNQYDPWMSVVTLDCTPVNSGCATGNAGKYAITHPSTQYLESNDYKNKLPLVVAAYVTNRTVFFTLDGCSPGSNFPLVREVYIK